MVGWQLYSYSPGQSWSRWHWRRCGRGGWKHPSPPALCPSGSERNILTNWLIDLVIVSFFNVRRMPKGCNIGLTAWQQIKGSGVRQKNGIVKDLLGKKKSLSGDTRWHNIVLTTDNPKCPPPPSWRGSASAWRKWTSGRWRECPGGVWWPTPRARSSQARSRTSNRPNRKTI